nr:HEAT repeat domain-containing protein [Myxococcus landrumus]
MSTPEHLGLTLAPVLVVVLENPESSWEELARVRYVLARRTVTRTETFAPRLRSLLARELAEPALRRPPGTSCPVSPAPGCEAVDDGCTPRAAYVASVLAAYERDGVEAAPEMFLALRRRDARLTPVAMQALVAFDSPAVVPEALQQLANSECRARALASLAFLGPGARPAATEPLLRLLASGAEGWERARAAKALGRLGDPTALEALRQAVYEPHSEVQAAAVWTLGNHAFRAHGDELSPLFQQVLREHPSPVARSHARWALQCLEGKAVRPADSSAPISVLPGRGPDWRMCQGHTSIQLQWDKPQAPSKEGPCGDVPDADSASVLEVVGAACLVGRDAGEFGGTLEVHEAGRVTVLEEPRANPLRAVRVYGSLVVVEGLSHLFGGEGRLVRVETSEGRWRATPWVDLPGAPLALGLDDERNLVMGTTEQRLDEIFCAEPRASSLVHALRITEDGHLAPLRQVDGPDGAAQEGALPRVGQEGDWRCRAPLQVRRFPVRNSLAQRWRVAWACARSASNWLATGFPVGVGATGLSAPVAPFLRTHMRGAAGMAGAGVEGVVSALGLRPRGMMTSGMLWGAASSTQAACSRPVAIMRRRFW